MSEEGAAVNAPSKKRGERWKMEVLKLELVRETHKGIQSTLFNESCTDLMNFFYTLSSICCILSSKLFLLFYIFYSPL